MSVMNRVLHRVLQVEYYATISPAWSETGTCNRTQADRFPDNRGNVAIRL